jgi:hypothetical protein
VQAHHRQLQRIRPVQQRDFQFGQRANDISNIGGLICPKYMKI